MTTALVMISIATDAEPYNSAVHIGIEYDRLLPSEDKMVFSPRMHDSALFYTHREAVVLDSGEELEAYLAADEQVFVLLSQDSRTDSDVFDGNYHVVYQVGNKAIVSNRPYVLASEFPQEADRR